VQVEIIMDLVVKIKELKKHQFHVHIVVKRDIQELIIVQVKRAGKNQEILRIIIIVITTDIVIMIIIIIMMKEDLISNFELEMILTI
jgi:hypothetical protein